MSTVEDEHASRLEWSILPRILGTLRLLHGRLVCTLCLCKNDIALEPLPPLQSLCSIIGITSRSGGALLLLVQVSAESHAHFNHSGRVVVTGQGVVSSLGQDVETFYNNLLEVSRFTKEAWK